MVVTEVTDTEDVGISPLLTVKFAQPGPTPDLLHRPDLVERLERGAPRVSLISAPAGWGKTSLLSAWLKSKRDSRTAFLRLEEGDNAGPLFWKYVIASLREVVPGLATGADEILQSPATDPMRKVVPSLLNELMDIEDDLLLVLDDYHVITADEIHYSMVYLIDHLPPSLRLAIATRSDPSLPLERLRASGVLNEVRVGELAFSRADTLEFLRNRFSVDLSDADADVLCRRTDGWPAAVQLAGLSLRDADDPNRFVRRFAGDDRNVAAYLMGEVLASVAPDVREFLDATCVLDELSGSLCDAVAETEGSGLLLQELQQSGLFVIPLDTHGGWYRYHHLFADWLRHELQRERRDLIPVLHRRAADWHADHGGLVPAIEHCFSGGDDRRALELLEESLGDWAAVEWPRLFRWMERVDEESSAGLPMIAVAKSLACMFVGDFARGMRWLQIAEAAVGLLPQDSRATIDHPLQEARGLAELWTGGDIEESRRLAIEVANAERPNASRLYLAAIGTAAVATFWTTGPLEAVPLLMEAQAARRDASYADSGVTALLALAHAELGSWAEATAAAALAFSQPPPPAYFKYPTLMLAHYAEARVLIAQGDREDAIERTEQGLALARTWPDLIWVAYGLLVMAEARSDFREKRALVREAREIASGDWGRGRILDLVAAAERKLDVRKPIGTSDGTAFVEELTEREAEVLRFLRSDLSLREIAIEMYISHNTIKSYTQSVYRKLGVTSRAAALETATELDII